MLSEDVMGRVNPELWFQPYQIFSVVCICYLLLLQGRSPRRTNMAVRTLAYVIVHTL